LTEIAGLRVRVENATRNVEKDYKKAVQTVGILKERMNDLEQRISQKKHEEADEDLSSLRSTIKSLDTLTDSQIQKSKEAWKKYEGLMQDCRMQTLLAPQLDELRILCKKTEQLAADLLCFSLGRFKQKKPID
jgi:hypothetical protein